MRFMPKTMRLWMAVVLIFAFIAAAPVQASANQSYKVQPNDTFWKIAGQYQVSLTELLQANPHLQNPNILYPNQTIKIPNQLPSEPIQQEQDLLAWEKQVAALVNEERAAAGLAPLAINRELSKVARHKSADMRDANYFSHQSPTYGSPFDMMQQFGIDFNYAGENIAAGQTSPEAVMEAWMNSPGHRENILNPNFTHIGVGYVAGGSYQHYWTQHFMSK